MACNRAARQGSHGERLRHHRRPHSLPVQSSADTNQAALAQRRKAPSEQRTNRPSQLIYDTTPQATLRTERLSMPQFVSRSQMSPRRTIIGGSDPTDALTRLFAFAIRLKRSARPAHDCNPHGAVTVPAVVIDMPKRLTRAGAILDCNAAMPTGDNAAARLPAGLMPTVHILPASFSVQYQAQEFTQMKTLARRDSCRPIHQEAGIHQAAERQNAAINVLMFFAPHKTP